MASEAQDKIRIEIMRHRRRLRPLRTHPRSQEAVLRLARLIGRQMAREQFAAERGQVTPPSANGSGKLELRQPLPTSNLYV